MNVRRISCLLALVTLTALLAGCNRPQPVIGVVPRTTGTLLWEPLHLGIAETARNSGLHIEWNGPADLSNVETQLNLLSRMQKKQLRGIIFAPEETLASRSVVLDAIKTNMPLVIVDDEVGPPAGPLLSYVTSDERAGASLAAKRIAQLLHGRGSIALIGVSPRSENGLRRQQYLEEDLAQIAPEIKVAVRVFGDANIPHQQQIAAEVLKRAPAVDLIVALTPFATRGAYYAKLASTPRSRVPVVGFDQDILFPVQTGDIDSVVVQNTREIGRIAFEHMQQELAGKPPEGHTLVAPFLLTRETLTSPTIISLLAYESYDWSTQ